jgi:hypothetical protein
MMQPLTLGILLLAVAVSVAAARAQDKPLFAPTRDVTVQYNLTGADQQNGAEKLQVAYADGGQRVRMDYFRYPEAKNPFGSLIYDGKARQVLMILPEEYTYIVRDAGKVANPSKLLDANMEFKRQGTDTVAGVNCTQWLITAYGKPGSACVTDDGVVLRIARTEPKPGAMEAYAVAYGSQPDDVFSVPLDFKRLAPDEPPVFSKVIAPEKGTAAVTPMQPALTNAGPAVAPPPAAVQPEPEAPSQPVQPVAPKLAGSEAAPTPPQPAPPSASDTVLAPPAAPAAAALPPGWTIVGEPPKQ